MLERFNFLSNFRLAMLSAYSTFWIINIAVLKKKIDGFAKFVFIAVESRLLVLKAKIIFAILFMNKNFTMQIIKLVSPLCCSSTYQFTVPLTYYVNG